MINQDLLVDRAPRLFHAFPNAYGQWFCPVPGCGSEASKGWNMHRHFIERHERDLVKLLRNQILYPRCDSCDMQVNPESTDRKSVV